MRTILQRILGTATGFNTIAIIAAFGTYTCMYGFRRPFTVGNFGDVQFLGLDYKVCLIIAQVIGYTVSKFLGIKIIAEMEARRRIFFLFICIFAAECALFLFAVTPAPWNIFFLFVNGLPLGLIWGLVFSFLEGRRSTELLGAGLCITFILSSGFVKSVGGWILIHMGVSSYTMPALTGLFFLPPLLLFAALLMRLPQPDPDDVRERLERVPMSHEERRRVRQRFALGLIALIFLYSVLTAYRDLRDNFAREIWTAFGYGNAPGIFSLSEIPVAVGILLLLACLRFIKDNSLAFFVNLWIIGGGLALVAIATLLTQAKAIDGLTWMILTGIGSYAAYIPFNVMLFERMIATFRISGNAGFLIYQADAFGYLGSVMVLLAKNVFQPKITWLSFIEKSGYVLGAIGVLGIAYSLVYFGKKYRKQPGHS